MTFEVRCRELYQELAEDTPAGPVHVIARDAEPVLSAWHSAHHALVLRHLDRERAVGELETLYRACQLPDGFVVRERSIAELKSGAQPPEQADRFAVPPVAAYAVARLARGGQSVPEKLLECAVRQLDAIWSDRLPPDTPLPVILHPQESAVAETPLFDSVIEASEDGEWEQEYGSLARSARACRFDPDRALRAGHSFVVEDPAFCGWFLLAMEEVAAAFEERGDLETCRKLRIRAEMIASGISERLWQEGDEIFAAYDRQRDDPLCGVTAAA